MPDSEFADLLGGGQREDAVDEAAKRCSRQANRTAVFVAGHANVGVLQQTVCTEEGTGWCDVYSKGSGFCQISLGLRRKSASLPAGGLEGSNCGGYGNVTEDILRTSGWDFAHPPVMGRGVPWLACPLRVPIAAIRMPVGGSTSFDAWLLRLDGHLRRNRRLARLAARGGEAALAHEGFVELLTAAPECADSGAAGGTRAAAATRAETEAERALFLHRVADVGGLVLPPPLCLTCCAAGSGRLRVLLARNPFARLASYFKTTRLKYWRTWNAFAPFVAHLHSLKFKERMELYELLPWHSFGNIAGPSDIYHTRSVWDTLADPRLLWARQSREPFLVLHLETFEQDLAQLSSSLCERFGHCEPLPPLSHGSHRRKSNTSELPAQDPELWLHLWGTNEALSRAARDTLELYAWDFAALGYSQDPWQLAPRSVDEPRWIYPPW